MKVDYVLPSFTFFIFVHRLRKRWEDNIKEWTGLEFGKSRRAVGNGKMEKKSSVVPQRPSRLRD